MTQLILINYSSPQEAHKKLMHHLTTETIDNVMFTLYIPIVESYMDNGRDTCYVLVDPEMQCL